MFVCKFGEAFLLQIKKQYSKETPSKIVFYTGKTVHPQNRKLCNFYKTNKRRPNGINLLSFCFWTFRNYTW